jgi:hypothetical protein
MLVGAPLWDEDRVFAGIKNFCMQPSAMLFGTPSDVPSIRRGAFYTWSRTRFGKNARITLQNISVAQAFFGLRKASGHASDRMILMNIEKHVKALQTSTPNDTNVEEIFSAIRPVLDYLKGFVRGEGECVWMDDHVAQTGCTSSSRVYGGKLGDLLRRYEGFPGNGRDTHEPFVEHIDEFGTKLPIDPEKDALDGSHARARFCTTRQDPAAAALQEEPVARLGLRLADDGPSVVVTAEYPRTEYDWATHVYRTAREELEAGDTGYVHYSAVCESGGKIRGVTKSAPACSVYARKFQQVLFRGMGTLGCFPSLTRKITALEVSHVVGVPTEKTVLASSDFRSATDLLNPSVTNRMLEYLLDGTGFDREIILDDNADKEVRYQKVPSDFDDQIDAAALQHCGRRYGLGPWKRRYPTTFIWVGGKEYKPETWEFYEVRARKITGEKTCGQLMGQSTSFPLLCLVNLGASLAAARRVDPDYNWKRYVGLGRPPLLIINGDDRLARSSRGMEDNFWELAESVGLCRSPGKSHESRNFAVINSQDYHVSATGHVRRVQVLNTSLLFGIKKIRGDAFRPEMVYSAFVETVDRHYADRAIGNFFSMWREEIDRACQGRNLFVPVRLGGMGQNPGDHTKWFVSEYQRELAALMASLQPFRDLAFGPARCVQSSGPDYGVSPWQPAVSAWDEASVDVQLKNLGLKEEAAECRRLAAQARFQVSCSGTRYECTENKDVHEYRVSTYECTSAPGARCKGCGFRHRVCQGLSVVAWDEVVSYHGEPRTCSRYTFVCSVHRDRSCMRSEVFREYSTGTFVMGKVSVHRSKLVLPMTEEELRACVSGSVSPSPLRDAAGRRDRLVTTWKGAKLKSRNDSLMYRFAHLVPLPLGEV